jgi:hypothetical protein
MVRVFSFTKIAEKRLRGERTLKHRKEFTEDIVEHIYKLRSDGVEPVRGQISYFRKR